MKLSYQDIKKMNYTDFIALIKETNRCPGGKDSVRRIVQNTFINKESTVLEVGSNTGFTSLELAHTVGCNVYGIDVSVNCVRESIEKLSHDIKQIQNRVHFQLGSAYKIPFKDNTFDLVVAGGATSFMEEKSKAIDEYSRVVKPWGFISITQLFYRKKPPQKLVDNVSRAIGVKINVWDEKDWLKTFSNNPKLELYFYERHQLNSRDKRDVDVYINYFMEKPHLKSFDDKTRKEIRRKWKHYINVFNENHNYLGYFIAIFRKDIQKEEPELFIRE